MSSGKKKPVKVGLRGKNLKDSHDRTEGLLKSHHQNNTDKSQADLDKGQAALDERRQEIMRQVAEHGKLQEEHDKAQRIHDQQESDQDTDRKALRKAHRDIQDEDAALPPDEE